MMYLTSLSVCSLNPCSNGIWSLTFGWFVVLHYPYDVLILVLMEYGLWLSFLFIKAEKLGCLNPCSNGIWSLTERLMTIARIYSLNPCSNGIWSLTVFRPGKHLVSVCLNPCSNGIWSLTGTCHRAGVPEAVLILVLMEYGLWLNFSWAFNELLKSLNPCSNGIWSLTIMVSYYVHGFTGLNPCSNGIWSLTRW